MRQPPSLRSRTPRRVAAVVLLAAIIGSLVVTLVSSPAGAVPVDGFYTGTISNPGLGTSATMSVRLSTSAPNRFPVAAAVTLGPGLTVSCNGTQMVPPTATTPVPAPLLLNGIGGAPSAAPVGVASLTLNGSTMSGSTAIPITIQAILLPDRSRILGTATLDLPDIPGVCGDAVLSFDVFANRPYAIRTGHDGTTFLDPSGVAVDITHMIDRQPAGQTENGKRCMYLWARQPSGAPVPGDAVWSIEGATPPGARIEAGWEHGTPTTEPGDGTPAPLRTRVCIDDTTPVDATFTVAIAPDSGPVAGRVLLWVGTYRNYPARAQGDVHNTTFDEVHYDFQGVGEYVDAVADDGKELAVQSRLETVPNAPVTVTTAIAARVNGDRIGVTLDAAGRVEWSLDGRPLAVPATLPSGGTITSPTADHWRVTWPDTTKDPGATTGTTMQVSLARWTPKDHLNIDELLLGPYLVPGQVRGLLGTADRDPGNDLTPSYGGSPVSADIDPNRPPYEQPLYAEFGRSWLVSPKSGSSETLFDYLDPAHPDPASYVNETFPSERPGVVDRKAAAACQKAGVTAWPQLDFCTYDVGVTGAREIAAYYRDGWLPV